MNAQQILVISLDEFILRLPDMKNKLWNDLSQIHDLTTPDLFLMASFDANLDKLERLMREYPKHAPYFEVVQKRYDVFLQNQLDTLTLNPTRAQELLELSQMIEIVLVSNLRRKDLDRLSLLQSLPFTPKGIYTTKEVISGKPDADIYLKIARQLNVHPTKLITCDATLNGVQAGYLASTKALFVEEFYERTTGVEEYSTAYVASFKDIKTTLEGWLINRNG